MAFDDTQIKEANIELEKKMTSDRESWQDKINKVVMMIKYVSELAECQVLMLSYRQQLLEKIADFKSIIYKRNSTWDKYYKIHYRDYTINYDIKLTNSEKNQFIKGDLSALKHQIDMLQSHVDYYQECIKTLDNMAFAIRNRIRLDDEQI